MKYLKVTLVIFLATFLISSFGMNAQSYSIVDMTIPILGQAAYSSQKDKLTFEGYHMLSKSNCYDDISGDQRAILGHIKE